MRHYERYGAVLELRRGTPEGVDLQRMRRPRAGGKEAVEVRLRKRVRSALVPVLHLSKLRTPRKEEARVGTVVGSWYRANMDCRSA